MTLYQIEVRANAERHDVHARHLAREILQLPGQHLPSLAALSVSQTPLYLRTAQLYCLTGTLSPSHLSQLTQQLLTDPVVQEALTGDGAPLSNATSSPTEHIVDVFFHPGVTDTLAESVLIGARMLAISGLSGAETGKRYRLDGRLSEDDARAIAQALLYNPVIQHYILTPAGMPLADTEAQSQASSSVLSAQTVAPEQTSNVTRTIALSGMNDEQLQQVSKAGLLSLNLDEMRAIQQHYQSQGREPTDVELETLAQTWSEHCSHKTFKATIQYQEVDAQGHVYSAETISGLLKRYIMRATEAVRQDWLVSAFSDNAGIIRLNETQDIAFKAETHNHPSAIEPFGGANTGVGGVIRDVLGVSAQPIACTDVLCFGPLDTAPDTLPPGVLPPSRIASGVISGVRDYGNKMGIPTVNGAVLYHPGYIYNPLVFCGCVGILPHGSHPNNVQPGDLIVSLGGRTGRDGIHGATFSSGEMSLEINTQAGAAVQIGAPITEKKVSDVIIQARDRQLYSAITDCGAGGFSSAIGEMGAKTGAYVELEKAPLKYQGLTPWEIWLSEAQERMILAVPPVHLPELLSICAIEEVEASVLGHFTDNHRLKLRYHGETVADMDMTFLHDGIPNKTLQATWHYARQATKNTIPEAPAPALVQATSEALTSALLALLSHPNIASKEQVVRRYDHEVQGATVIKPLVGRAGNGPGDAAVLQPLINEDPASAGVVISNGVNPLYGKIDPYHMAINAVDEALRNLTAVGGDVSRAAILDNFCWGNPNDPQQLGLLVRAVKGCYDAVLGFGTPFISGKDSLNNEYRANGQRLPVIPTLLISAIGVIDDARQTIDMALKTPGNRLYQIGSTSIELGGSHYAEVSDPDVFRQLFPHPAVPEVDLSRALATMQALGEAIRRGLVRSCHDLSEGGLLIAAAEMSLAGLLGARLDLQHLAIKDAASLPSGIATLVRLFSESASRFLVEIAPEHVSAFEQHMRDRGVEDITSIGTVTNDARFVVHHGDEELIHLGVSELQAAWKGGQA